MPDEVVPTVRHILSFLPNADTIERAANQLEQADTVDWRLWRDGKLLGWGSVNTQSAA